MRTLLKWLNWEENKWITLLMKLGSDAKRKYTEKFEFHHIFS